LAFLVIIHVNGDDGDGDGKLDANGNKVAPDHNDKVIDFTAILPNFPPIGRVVATSETEDHPYDSEIDMSKVSIHQFSGFVIEIDYSQKIINE
jgi:hypothetical protein